MQATMEDLPMNRTPRPLATALAVAAGAAFATLAAQIGRAHV